MKKYLCLIVIASILIVIASVLLFSPLCLFPQANNSNNAYLDRGNVKYNELLIVTNSDYSAGSYDNMADFKRLFSLGLGHQNNKEYEDAMDYYIAAIKNCSYQIAYYQLGVCLMIIGGYENAIRSFEKSKNAGYYEYYWLIDDLYSYDTNGVRREDYFATYNIACIKSLQNDITGSFDYLCKAIYEGYPYINHIKTDTDISNLFAYNNGFYLTSMERIFNARSNNTVAGKGYRLAWGGAPFQYHFVSNTRVRVLVGSVWPDPGGWLEGNYVVRNYNIIITNIVYHYDETLRRERMIQNIKELVESGEFEEMPLNRGR